MKILKEKLNEKTKTNKKNNSEIFIFSKNFNEAKWKI